MKKTFYELYLEKKNCSEQPELSYQDIPRIRSPSRLWLRLKYYFSQSVKLIIRIFIFVLATIGAFALTNPYIRNEILWLLRK